MLLGALCCVSVPIIYMGLSGVQDLVESVSDMSKANDWFLVAPDFTDYMRAQVLRTSQQLCFGLYQTYGLICAAPVLCRYLDL